MCCVLRVACCMLNVVCAFSLLFDVRLFACFFVFDLCLVVFVLFDMCCVELLRVLDCVLIVVR